MAVRPCEFESHPGHRKRASVFSDARFSFTPPLLLQFRVYLNVIDSPTNQQFFVLPNGVIDRQQEQVSFGLWEAAPRGEDAVALRDRLRHPCRRHQRPADPHRLAETLKGYIRNFIYKVFYI